MKKKVLEIIGLIASIWITGSFLIGLAIIAGAVFDIPSMVLVSFIILPIVWGIFGPAIQSASNLGSSDR